MKQGKKISKSKFWPDNWEEFMEDCLNRSHERLRKEMGFGIPNSKQLNIFGELPEDD